MAEPITQSIKFLFVKGKLLTTLPHQNGFLFAHNSIFVNQSMRWYSRDVFSYESIVYGVQCVEGSVCLAHTEYR